MLDKRRAMRFTMPMEANELSAPVYSPRTCRRCKGTGHVNHTFLGGRCFGCQGTGSEMVETGRRSLTADEAAKVAEYQAGIAAAEARAAARAAGYEERKARRAAERAEASS